jgi:hypothetical protein
MTSVSSESVQTFIEEVSDIIKIDTEAKYVSNGISELFKPFQTNMSNLIRDAHQLHEGLSQISSDEVRYNLFRELQRRRKKLVRSQRALIDKTLMEQTHA